MSVRACNWDIAWDIAREIAWEIEGKSRRKQAHLELEAGTGLLGGGYLGGFSGNIWMRWANVREFCRAGKMQSPSKNKSIL